MAVGTIAISPPTGQCVEDFEDIEVMEIAEAIGKVWILGYDGEPVLLSSVDRQDWSRLVLPSYASYLAVSDDGALFFDHLDAGVLVYRDSEWSNLTFDAPSFVRPDGQKHGNEGPLDVAFLGSDTYFTENDRDSVVNGFDGDIAASRPAFFLAAFRRFSRRPLDCWR